MRALFLLILIPGSYLVGCLTQVTLLYFWSGGGAGPRMFWERMPWMLLLSPLYPLLSFDLLMRNADAQHFATFALFLVPFLLALAASLAWVFRAPRG